MWLDATYLKVRGGGRIVSVAAIIAVAADTEGRREIVGLHLGPSEAETFWTTFLKGLLRRGLKGVKLDKTVCHARREYARDEDDDGFCEVHVNTMEGVWSLLRSWFGRTGASRRRSCPSTSASSVRAQRPVPG